MFKKLINAVNPVKRVFVAEGRQPEAEEIMTDLGIKVTEKVDQMKYRIGFDSAPMRQGTRYTLVTDPVRYGILKSKMSFRNEGKPLEIL